MRNIGILLLVFGVGSFVLPLMGLQFKIMDVMGDARPVIAGIMAMVGVVLIVLSVRRGKAEAGAAGAAAATPQQASEGGDRGEKT